ncbi:hypothetical protein D3C87_1736920 [compost metagenome]
MPTEGDALVVALQREDARELIEVAFDAALADDEPCILEALHQVGAGNAGWSAGQLAKQFPLAAEGSLGFGRWQNGRPCLVLRWLTGQGWRQAGFMAIGHLSCTQFV